nr:Crp/Fnr family transcriptional regulator [uncultured Dyadobacter sp.]
METADVNAVRLIDHIKTITGSPVEDGNAILQSFNSDFVPKKQVIQQAARECTTLFFVARGCLRMFFVDNKGVERTTQFALENWWLTDFMAFEKRQHTEFYIQAVEATQVLSIDYRSYERLLDSYPQMERYFRKIYQRGYGASLLRMKYQQDFSREELYRHFASLYPEFVQRVPQYLLASYLDITPEYLSELRKKRS